MKVTNVNIISMLEGLKDVCMFVIGLLSVVILVVVGAIVFLVRPADVRTCERDGMVSGFETKIVGGLLNYDCYVKVDGQWVPRSTWRTVEE